MSTTYRFKGVIEDEDGEVILSCSTYMGHVNEDGSCEPIEMELFSMLRAYKRKIQDHAPVSEDEV